MTTKNKQKASEHYSKTFERQLKNDPDVQAHCRTTFIVCAAVLVVSGGCAIVALLQYFTQKGTL